MHSVLMVISLTSTGFLAIVAIIFVWKCHLLTKRLNKKQASLDFYNDLVQVRNGFVLGYGNYKIVSFDKRKTWYNYEETNEPVVLLPDGGYRGAHGYILKGLADPEMVKSIEGFDRLGEAVRAGRQVDLGLLTGAGFTVEKK